MKHTLLVLILSVTFAQSWAQDLTSGNAATGDYFPRHPHWKIGGLQFTSTVTDGYQRYKLALYLGDGNAVVFWNRAGRMGVEDGSFCPQCLKLQVVMDKMLANCKEMGATVCVHKQDLRYLNVKCDGQGKEKCFYLEFEPNELIAFVAPVMTAAEAGSSTNEILWQSKAAVH